MKKKEKHRRAAVSPRGHEEQGSPEQQNSSSSGLVTELAPAAAAKSLQSCLTLCNPTDSSPSGFSIHRILQAR